MEGVYEKKFSEKEGDKHDDARDKVCGSWILSDGSSHMDFLLRCESGNWETGDHAYERIR